MSTSGEIQDTTQDPLDANLLDADPPVDPPVHQDHYEDVDMPGPFLRTENAQNIMIKMIIRLKRARSITQATRKHPIYSKARTINQ
jgi:hypothetical protein